MGPGQETEPVIDPFDTFMADADKPAPEPKPEESPKEAEPEKPVVEETPAEEPAKKPEEKAADTVTDPDTGDDVDLRTREGKRIQRLLARTHEAESRARRAEEALFAKPKDAAKEETPQPDVKAAPKPEDFATVDEYIDAKVKFGIDTALAADRAAQQETTRQREATARAAAIDAREAAFVKEHPDYFEKLGESFHPMLNRGLEMKHPTALAIRDALQSSEEGPRLAYLLAENNGAEHARLAALPPGLALLELGKLVAATEAPKVPKEAPKEERRSAAPPPPDHVAGRSSAADPDPMSRDFDSHVAIGNREDAALSRSRRRGAA